MCIRDRIKGSGRPHSARSEENIEADKEKYKETWKSKLKEVVNKMMDKVK